MSRFAKRDPGCDSNSSDASYMLHFTINPATQTLKNLTTTHVEKPFFVTKVIEEGK